MAAIGSSAFGGVISGAAFVLAPPTLLTSVGIGCIWAVGKWGFRRTRVADKLGLDDPKEWHEQTEKAPWREVQGPTAVPW